MVGVRSKRPNRLPNPAETLRREALDEVRAVYREVENRPVERACIRRTECCQFKLTGRTPMLTKGEAVLAAKALRAFGRKEMPEREDGACPMLRDNGACMIYQDRPFGCRTHFCAAAGGPYARGEGAGPDPALGSGGREAGRSGSASVAGGGPGRDARRWLNGLHGLLL